jgi:hypothetical protein
MASKAQPICTLTDPTLTDAIAKTFKSQRAVPTKASLAAIAKNPRVKVVQMNGNSALENTQSTIRQYSSFHITQA